MPLATFFSYRMRRLTKNGNHLAGRISECGILTAINCFYLNLSYNTKKGAKTERQLQEFETSKCLPHPDYLRRQARNDGIATIFHVMKRDK